MGPELGPYPLLSCFPEVKSMGPHRQYSWYTRIPDAGSRLKALGLDRRW